MTTINAVTSDSIRHAEFVKLSVGEPVSAEYLFCNAASPITVGTDTFNNLGSLLSVGDVQRDVKATSDDMTIQLTGIDPTNIALILSSDIKGSLIEVWRGFLDTNNQIITTPTLQFFKRYQGIINNVSIAENWDTEKRIRVATCNVSCSSMRRILENRIAGIRTNKNNWQFIYPTDESMNRPDEIANTYFDFGGTPKRDTQASSTVATGDG
jgi:hypothetical protein|tara:strand:+ start:1984 stop:2616 length:633 start_codon:yes stop_codon:yes gene_type:complete